MSDIKLTIGVTYHNERELLTYCLDSLLTQIDDTVEVLIYDDASTSPAKDHVPASQRVRIIRGEKNIGPAKGRNLLLSEARGEYIHFHDSDDWFHETWFKKVSKELGKVDAVFTEVTSFRNDKLFVRHVMEVVKLATEKDLLKYAIQSFMLVPSGTYKKKVLSKIKGYREDLWQSEDWDFHVRLALEKPSFTVISEPLVYIRVRKESRSQNTSETARDTLKAIELLKPSVPDSYRCYLSDKAAWVGSKLFILGQKQEAKKAFELSRDLGPSTFYWQRNSYQYIAKCFGQEWAEISGALFRSLKTMCSKKHNY